MMPRMNQQDHVSKRGSVNVELDASITWQLDEDGKRVAIGLPAALSKTGVNGLIDALKKIREHMVR
jgi:hypothetical protein